MDALKQPASCLGSCSPRQLRAEQHGPVTRATACVHAGRSHTQLRAALRGLFPWHSGCPAMQQMPSAQAGLCGPPRPPLRTHLIGAAKPCSQRGDCRSQGPTCSFGRPGADVVRQHGPAPHIVAFHVGHQEVMPFPERRRQKPIGLRHSPGQGPSSLPAAAFPCGCRHSAAEAAAPGLPNAKRASSAAGTPSICQDAEPVESSSGTPPRGSGPLRVGTPPASEPDLRKASWSQV